MNHDIKLPEPADYIYKCDGTLDVQRIPFYTADQLRAAVLADRAERASAADLELPSLAIREGRRCVDRLDGYAVLSKPIQRVMRASDWVPEVQVNQLIRQDV